jgi:hypothetical protein
MITESQFTKARQLIAVKQELQRLEQRFKSAGVTLGLCFSYGHNGAIAKDDDAARFNHLKRDLVRRLNREALIDLQAGISDINTQLLEFVRSDA